MSNRRRLPDEERFGISHLAISIRTFNALRKAGIVDVAQLLDMAKADVLRIRGIGVCAMAEISESIANDYWRSGADFLKWPKDTRNA